MRRHNRQLYRIARATMQHSDKAEDASQEAYLAAYCGMRKHRGDATLATWLSLLVLKECFGRLRKGARRSNVVSMIAGDEVQSVGTKAMRGPDQIEGRTQMRALIELKLDSLPELLRVTLVLRAVEELSVEETAACLSIPAATVRTRYSRARALLRESIARDIDVAERDLFAFGGQRCDRIVQTVFSQLQKDTQWKP